MTLKSCLGIADILKATEKTVHTQFSDKSVTSHIRSHGIFSMIFLHYMHLQIPLKVNALLTIFKLHDIYFYAMCFSFLSTFIISKLFFKSIKNTLERKERPCFVFIDCVKCVPGLD